MVPVYPPGDGAGKSADEDQSGEDSPFYRIGIFPFADIAWEGNPMAASTEEQLAALRNANRILREALEWVARNANDPKARTLAEEALLGREPAAVHPHEIDGEWFI